MDKLRSCRMMSGKQQAANSMQAIAWDWDGRFKLNSFKLSL